MNPVGHAGHSSPLGATVVDGGVNFSLFSRSATGVELLLFDRDDDARPARVMRLDPAANRTYHCWHVCMPGVQPGQLYGCNGHPRAPWCLGCTSVASRATSVLGRQHRSRHHSGHLALPLSPSSRSPKRKSLK